ncbi:MAG: SAM-dependent DNA methyltransferase [Myxococcales bacterium]|nr:SAM-dependent DNA methyltransferase [Myxococcales bacterium]
MSGDRPNMLELESSSEAQREAKARKSRGAFFTPGALTRVMVDWAIRSGSDRVLEPSCGEAAFLLDAARRLRGLGELLPALHGYDLHGPSLTRAAASLRELGVIATLEERDFFAVPATGDFDAVIGNPPYLRYQAFSGELRARGLAVAEAHGVKLNQLANAWAAFVVHAAQFLRPRGRLALVLPAVLLTVNYAAPVRRFLVERFGRVQLVMFRERVFPGVLEEVVLLLAEGKGPTRELEVVHLGDAGDLNPRALARATRLPLERQAGDKWTQALLPGGALTRYRDAIAEAGFTTLGELCELELGIVTGNNKFFTLTQDEVRARKLPERDLLRISPAGSRHLRGLSYTRRARDRQTEEGRRTFLFYPSPGDKTPSRAARRYIVEGEAEGVHTAYKCRVRAPWWRVPLVRAPDLIFTYMSGDAPRLVSNAARAHVLNSVHGVVLRDRDAVSRARALLPVATLNSLTLLGAELLGRSYGGGILKVEPGEARQLPVPPLAALAAAEDALMSIKPGVSAALRRGALEDAVARVDEVLLVSALGLPAAAARELNAAWRELKGRRAARSKSNPA